MKQLLILACMMATLVALPDAAAQTPSKRHTKPRRQTVTTMDVDSDRTTIVLRPQIHVRDSMVIPLRSRDGKAPYSEIRAVPDTLMPEGQWATGIEQRRRPKPQQTWVEGVSRETVTQENVARIAIGDDITKVEDLLGPGTVSGEIRGPGDYHAITYEYQRHDGTASVRITVAENRVIGMDRTEMGARIEE